MWGILKAIFYIFLSWTPFSHHFASKWLMRLQHLKLIKYWARALQLTAAKQTAIVILRDVCFATDCHYKYLTTLRNLTFCLIPSVFCCGKPILTQGQVLFWNLFLRVVAPVISEIKPNYASCTPANPFSKSVMTWIWEQDFSLSEKRCTKKR